MAELRDVGDQRCDREVIQSDIPVLVAFWGEYSPPRRALGGARPKQDSQVDRSSAGRRRWLAQLGEVAGLQLVQVGAIDPLQGPFEVSAARALLAQIAAALAAAHDCRVIHRDVKPENVLVEAESGRAYLTDFGVAGILESGTEEVTRLTREDDRLGDPTYMSPEQLRGEALTPQTDIYSLGVLACNILTTHGPFGDAEITDMAWAHIRRAPINIHETRPDIPRELGDVLQRCLAKKPEHRPHAEALASQNRGGNGPRRVLT